MRRGLVMRRFRGDFLAHLGLLGRLLTSFWYCWDAFGPHFKSLGVPWGTFSTQVGPSWPKLATNLDFLNLSS